MTAKAREGIREAPGLEVQRVHPTRDQKKHMDHAWSVHAGDAFRVVQQQRALEQAKAAAFVGQLKRSISFSAQLTEEVILSPCLKQPSMRRIALKNAPLQQPPGPPDTIEVTYLLYADPEVGLGFEVDAYNRVVSVSATPPVLQRPPSRTSEHTRFASNSPFLQSRLGTLCRDDVIIAVDGRTAKKGTVLELLPKTKSFVLFDVKRQVQVDSACPTSPTGGTQLPSSPTRRAQLPSSPIRRAQLPSSPKPGGQLGVAEPISPRFKPLKRVSSSVGSGLDSLGTVSRVVADIAEGSALVMTVVISAKRLERLGISAESIVTSLGDEAGAEDAATNQNDEPLNTLAVGDKIISVNGRPLHRTETVAGVAAAMQEELGRRRVALKCMKFESRFVLTICRPAINRGKNRKRSAFMVGFGGKVRKFMDTPADGTLTAYNKVHEVASRVSEELEALTLAECR